MIFMWLTLFLFFFFFLHCVFPVSDQFIFFIEFLSLKSLLCLLSELLLKRMSGRIYLFLLTVGDMANRALTF